MRGFPNLPSQLCVFKNPIDRDAVLKLCRTNIANFHLNRQEKKFKFEKFFVAQFNGKAKNLQGCVGA